MSSCLGLFVQNNLIKYAKISKENDNIKIENYGVKFYENDLEKVAKQIVDETFSYKIPISINMLNEKYTKSEIFALLSESDQKKSVRTEFEYFCNETSKNRLALDYRALFSPNKKDNEKKNILYAFTEKGTIAEKIQMLDPYKISNLSPVSFAIQTLPREDNCMIINIEDRTEITTIENGKINKVDVIEIGMDEILKKIADRENSTSKAYEICKNTTMYTTNSQNLQTDSNEYLDLIASTTYKIAEEARKKINKDENDIEKIYITGTGALINNIDLYFQERFLDYKCEILTPYFVDKTSLKINIKDYIEVNSAIAMAMQVLNKKNKDVNFVSNSNLWQNLWQKLQGDVSFPTKNKLNKKNFDLKKTVNFNIKEINCIRLAYGMFVILLAYIIITSLIHGNLSKKTKLAEETIADTKVKTEQVGKYTTLINARSKNYEAVLEQLQEADERASEAYKSKNAVPNLLSELMFAIPKQAQILSISNTEDKHIIIEAQSEEYQYLGYLKSEIQNRAILVNVTSTSGTRVNDMIQVTIEGDLPY